MSVAIKLYQRTLSESQEDQEFLAVIPSFPKTGCLDDLRRKIEEDELTSNGNYLFVQADHTCGKEDEKTLTIEVLTCTTDDINIRQVDVQIKFVEEETEHTNNDDTVTAKEDHARHDAMSSSETEPSGTSWLNFKNPKPWEIKRIKIYTPEEISKARGMKSLYYNFWNKRAKALCSRAPNLSKQSICTKINEGWRYEQERILKEEAEVIHKTEHTPPDSLKAGTLNNNMSSIEEASAKLRAVTAKLGGQKPLHASRKDLLAEQARAKSKLKRAQESMRKNLKIKKSKIDAVVGNKD
ncbi:hypothetical protein OS493_033633 [Desmophyllum pertusum]|uniref:Uncharacterized protein n=1 Tax=Desmophyllum pertusum TaxID=174260 RepID=A0A9W9YJ77_9CNID|nr:hypothetical protein OS493_033633 [Desmophyllum pertusum]